MSDALLPQAFADLRHLGEWIVATEEGRHRKKIAVDIESARRFFASSRISFVLRAPHRVTPSSRTLSSMSRSRTPPAAFTWTDAGECLRMSARSSSVAPLVPKPVDVFTQSAPSSPQICQSRIFCSSFR